MKPSTVRSGADTSRSASGCEGLRCGPSLRKSVTGTWNGPVIASCVGRPVLPSLMGSSYWSA